MTLGSVLAAYGIENRRLHRVKSGRNNEHWYVGVDLVLRRYGPSRSDAAITYEHRVVEALEERGWPVAVAKESVSGRKVEVDDGRRYALFPRLAGRRGNPSRPRQPRELGRLLAHLHRDLARASIPAPQESFPRVFATGDDPVWQRLGELDDPDLTGRIRGSLTEIRSKAGPASSGPLQVVHGDWHDGNLLYLNGSVSGILDFDFVHPDLALVDVAIAAVIPEVADAAEIVMGYFGSQTPTDHELGVLAVAQQARGLGHIAHFVRRYLAGDHDALGQIRIGADLLHRAEQRWPMLQAAILSGAVT